MSEGKHTPGPWVVPSGSGNGTIICEGDDADRPGRILFVLRPALGTSQPTPEDELVACASLCAAAPDLLAAVRAAEAIIVRWNISSAVIDGKQIGALLLDAMNKAEA